ncbi:MAG: type II toxin-antitoxin system VapC family toxin [Euryarchaeota archaeon]|nr:type II toxin-antitoxin system VapC family toxin [Euryarchaeota archaeon]
MEYLIDTSVLVSASIRGHEFRDRALSLLQGVEGQKLVNTVVLFEYAGVFRRLSGEAAASTALSEISRTYRYHTVPLSTLLAAMPHFKYGVADAIIGQHAMENGWRLATLDGGFRRFVPENLLLTRPER